MLSELTYYGRLADKTQRLGGTVGVEWYLHQVEDSICTSITIVGTLRGLAL